MVLTPDGQCMVDVGIRSFQEIRWEDLTTLCKRGCKTIVCATACTSFYTFGIHNICIPQVCTTVY